MADSQKASLAERDIEQALATLKRGAQLLKYGRRGKPKFCPFRLSPDESMLLWYYGKKEKQLEFSQVSRIIPGQRTAIFQRYPRPEKEYQSFSLITNDRSLDLICKDKEEAEVWFVGLKSLISRQNQRKLKIVTKNDVILSPEPPRPVSQFSFTSFEGDCRKLESIPESSLGKAFSDIILYTAVGKSLGTVEPVTPSLSPQTSLVLGNSCGRISATDTFRLSLSSALSSSSQGSTQDDFDSLGDVYIWGESISEGLVGETGIGGYNNRGSSPPSPSISNFLPKSMRSSGVLDIQDIACGSRHAVVVTKQGDLYSWGEGSGGRLGHGLQEDVSQPSLIDTPIGLKFDKVACGLHHTCAITAYGDLYTWGNGSHNTGLLGHGSDVSYWGPKRVCGAIFEGLSIAYISCGPWHTALVTSTGQLFTFGEGTFGALGHANRNSIATPREVDTLKGQRSIRVSCGVWHTAAVVDLLINDEQPSSPLSSSSSFSSFKKNESGSSTSNNLMCGKLFTWGDGDMGQLGHGDTEPKLIPQCVAALEEVSVSRVACGQNLTVALTSMGRVYTMGSSNYGQLGRPLPADGKTPTCIESKLAESFVEDIVCGSYHVAALTSNGEVYTWGKGLHGQLGHGDSDGRDIPTRVNFLKDKLIKSIACGANFTAAICLQKWVSNVDNSICSGCQNPFNFRRKRHNCYNCGLVFCNVCSSQKSLKASLAPNDTKPFRVCDDCFIKLKKITEVGSVAKISNIRSGNSVKGPRLQPQSSRLSSTESFNLSESRNSRSDDRLFSPANGSTNALRFSTGSIKYQNGVDATKKYSSVSLPGSRMISRASSPASRKSSPIRCSTGSPSGALNQLEVAHDDSRYVNEKLSQEVMNLRAQVDDLTNKHKLLESELDRKSKQLTEAEKLAATEVEKSEAAKKVIESLTDQVGGLTPIYCNSQKLNGIKTELASERNTTRKKMELIGRNSLRASSHEHEEEEDDYGNQEGTAPKSASCDEEASKSNTHNTSSSSTTTTTTTSLPNNGSKKIRTKEWVKQDQPGVYITFSPLPGGGGNELKRVRFSRRIFTEEQAAKWWADNGDRVCTKHNVMSTT